MFSIDCPCARSFFKYCFSPGQVFFRKVFPGHRPGCKFVSAGLAGARKELKSMEAYYSRVKVDQKDRRLLERSGSSSATR